MHDLARLGVAESRFLLRLGRGEKAKHARGKLRIQPQRLERRNDRVAPELGRKPWNAGVGIRAGREGRRQQHKVGVRFVNPLVEKWP